MEICNRFAIACNVVCLYTYHSTDDIFVNCNWVVTWWQ